MSYRTIPYTLISTEAGWLALAQLGPHELQRSAPTADAAEQALFALIDWIWT